MLIAACLKQEAESDMGQRRKFVEFASILLGTRISFPAKFDTKDADTEKGVGK